MCPAPGMCPRPSPRWPRADHSGQPTAWLHTRKCFREMQRVCSVCWLTGWPDGSRVRPRTATASTRGGAGHACPASPETPLRWPLPHGMAEGRAGPRRLLESGAGSGGPAPALPPASCTPRLAVAWHTATQPARRHLLRLAALAPVLLPRPRAPAVLAGAAREARDGAVSSPRLQRHSAHSRQATDAST